MGDALPRQLRHGSRLMAIVQILEVGRSVAPDGRPGWRVRAVFFGRWDYTGSKLDDEDGWACDRMLDGGQPRWDRPFGDRTGVVRFLGDETRDILEAAISVAPPDATS